MRFFVPLLACGGILLCGVATQAQENADQCRERDPVVYSDIEQLARTLGFADGLESVRISEANTAPDATVIGERETSPDGTAFFVKLVPDTTQPGPWNTTVYVYGNQARPLGVQIDFLDHASYGVNARWINEQLLYLQVWLGRIVAIDLILDVDQRTFVSAAGANYGSFILSCDEKRGPGQ